MVFQRRGPGEGRNFLRPRALARRGLELIFSQSPEREKVEPFSSGKKTQGMVKYYTGKEEVKKGAYAYRNFLPYRGQEEGSMLL